MKTLKIANRASVAFLIAAAAWIGAVHILPAGPSATWILLLGAIFCLSFVWMLIFRLRVLLGDPERRWRDLALLLGSFALMVLVFAWVHQQIGLMDMSGAGTRGTRDFSDALYFSVVTITTVGYGDFIPTGAGRSIAALQGLLGYFILGIMVSTGFQLIAPHTEPSLTPTQGDQGDERQRETS